MSDLTRQMNKLLMELLSTNYKKSAAHLAEELRVEYPNYYTNIMNTYASEFGLSQCGTLMSPITLVMQSLSQLHSDGFVTKTQINGSTLWQKKPAKDYFEQEE